MLKKIEGFGVLARFAKPVEGFHVMGVSKIVMLLLGSCVGGSNPRVSLVVVVVVQSLIIAIPGMHVRTCMYIYIINRWFRLVS